jgi:uncharacterized protein YceH (UPF0502 family)
VVEAAPSTAFIESGGSTTAQLEAEVAALRQEVAELRGQVERLLRLVE